MSWPDPNEYEPTSLWGKIILGGIIIAIVGLAASLIYPSAMMTEEQRIERCAAHQGALPEVGGIYHRRLDSLKVLILSAQFVYDPTMRNLRRDIDTFCGYHIRVRVEEHVEASAMNLFEFHPVGLISRYVRPDERKFHMTPTELRINEGE